MNKTLILALVILTSAQALGAPATPQKYCQSLAATSCEVLSVDLTPGFYATGTIHPIYLVKYCRNRVFKTATFSLDIQNSTVNAGTSSNTRYIRLYSGNVNVSAIVSVDNNLCSASWSDASTILP